MREKQELLRNVNAFAANMFTVFISSMLITFVVGFQLLFLSAFEVSASCS